MGVARKVPRRASDHPRRRAAVAGRRSTLRAGASPCWQQPRAIPTLKQAMIKATTEAEEQLVKPLFQFRNYGQQLPHNWSTIANEVRVRNRLFHAHGRCEIEHPGQFAERNEIFLPGPRCIGRAAQQRQPLHRDLREGSDAAGQRLLVAIDLQRAPFLRRQPDQPLLGRHQEQRPQAFPRRFAYNLRAARCAGGRRTARQLAASAEGGFFPLCPRLLAEGGSPRTARGHRLP